MDGNEVTISLKHLRKSFTKNRDVVQALDDFNLDVNQGEFVCLLGPSGCGKTTVLRIVAGLESASEGDAVVGGKKVTSAGPDRGMVFQEFALFPWRTVRKNIEFGLEVKGVPEDQRSRTSSQLIDLVGLKGFEDAHPKELSGGMKQRVGIA